MSKIPCVLTIAGSDSSAGAGIQADLKTFSALSVYGVCAITSVTAQNTSAISAIQDIAPDIVKRQIEAVADDIGVDTVKTGMIHSRKAMEVVYEYVGRRGFPTVVDPVMIAKDGTRLMEQDAVEILTRKLLSIATVVTPNALEAEVISGMKVRGVEDAKEAARKISDLGPRATVIKGGHISGDRVVDTLLYEGEFRFFESERLETKTTHGTGCTFSSAIAAELAKGTSIPEAVGIAKEFVDRAIKFGYAIGRGYGPVNPMAALYNDAEKYKVIKNLRDAVTLLESSREVSKLAPESQMNIVMALPYANSPSDVAGVAGRIVKVGETVKASSCREFGASRHVANTVLTVMRYDQSVRAGMNTKYSEEIIDICEKLHLTVSSYDRTKEPPNIKSAEGKTAPWGAEEAIRKIGKVPQVIFHTGDWGKEPMTTLLGKTAFEVANIAVRIAKELNKAEEPKPLTPKPTNTNCCIKEPDVSLA